MKIEVELSDVHVEHLDTLADVLGSSRDLVLTTALEELYKRKAHMLTEDAPWEITRTAQRKLLELEGKPVNEENLAWAEDVLHGQALDAIRAEREGRRSPSMSADGLLRYRGPRPPGAPKEARLFLVVRNGALVDVARHEPLK